jgi:molybdopterin molybdotransferase
MAKNTRSNIAIKGEDIKHGDRVLTKGTWIKPQQIAVLASVGCNRALVFKQPTVAIISTGDEIVEPWEKPGPTQIRNSNGYQLHGQVLLAGGKPKYIGIAPDKEEASFEMMDKALREYDILLLTGGVSMGHFDFIPGIIERLGATIRFKTLAVQPGKPTVFATFNKKRVFGLPGNPVSCFTIFILLVRPLILSMMGAAEKISPHALPLGESYTRKKSDRMSWIPVTVSSEGKLHPIEYHGSAHIRSLAGADAVAGIPAGVKELKTGDLLDVRFI